MLNSGDTLYVETPAKALGPNKTLEVIASIIDTHDMQRATEACLFVPIKSALESWLASVENTESRRKYIIGIQRLFKDSSLLFDITLESNIFGLDGSRTSGIYEYILTQFPGEGSYIRRLMATSYSQLSSFTANLTKGIVQPVLKPLEKSVYLRTKSVHTNIDWEKLISTLRKPYSRAAELLYIAGKAGFRLRVNAEHRNFLNLKTSQLDFEHCRILFTRDQVHGYFGVALDCPRNILMALKEEAVDGLVFTGRTRGKTLPLRSLNRIILAHSNSLCGINISADMFAWAGVIGLEQQWQKNFLLKLPRIKDYSYLLNRVKSRKETVLLKK